VRAVIEAQLDAFAATTPPALSPSPPRIRATFGDAETFMNMVRRSYAVVYRPSSVAFDAPLFIHASWCSPCGLPTPKAAPGWRSTRCSASPTAAGAPRLRARALRRDADLIRYHLFVDPLRIKTAI